MTLSGGKILVKSLEKQDVRRVFCVPGESYLDVLDALYDSPIKAVNARHEGGAAMMAEAHGKLTGRPGIAFVTRGPGATNAASGVHVAKQDSTPMILFIGQIARAMRGRDAFQEVDYRQTFSNLAKWVEEIDDVSRIPEVLNHAYHVAMSGRPGPVVLALPEDMLMDETDKEAGPYVDMVAPAPSPHNIQQFSDLLEESQNPFLIVGGSRWRAEDRELLERFAENNHLPVACSFRRQSLFNNLHPHYAGDVGLGINPSLKASLEQSDLIILLGARFSENPSQSFSLLDIPLPKQKLVHIHAGPEELGRIYTPHLAINATPGTFLEAVGTLERSEGRKKVQEYNEAYKKWSGTIPLFKEDGLHPGLIFKELKTLLGDEAILTNGAGNYAIWLHRFFQYQSFASQLAPTSGSMGYGLPAAIAAKLEKPERDVVALAGDGCFQMTMQEFASAVQLQLQIIVLVFDNGLYGTIKMHQESYYAGRPQATYLQNPDFAAFARACGGFGKTVDNEKDFSEIFREAQQKKGPSLLHIKTDPNIITPTKRLDNVS